MNSSKSNWCHCFFFQLVSKHHYNRKHDAIQFQKINWTFFCFYRNYSISFIKKLGRKLSQQFVESFRIFQKIKNLAYRLNILVHWKIYSIFTIVQLNLVSNSTINLYDHQRFRFSAMHVNENIETIKNFIVKKIIKIKQTARDKKYLIKWKRYKSKKMPEEICLK